MIDLDRPIQMNKARLATGFVFPGSVVQYG
jgi:hypothetical protein